MNMGTRFMATKEAPIHDNVKQALGRRHRLDTRLVMRPLRNTERGAEERRRRPSEKEREPGPKLEFRTSSPKSAASIRVS